MKLVNQVSADDVSPASTCSQMYNQHTTLFAIKGSNNKKTKKKKRNKPLQDKSNTTALSVISAWHYGIVAVASKGPRPALQQLIVAKDEIMHHALYFIVS